MKRESSHKIFTGPFSLHKLLHPLHNFPPDGKTKTAQKNQSHRRKVYQRVRYKRSKRGFANEIDSRITESGNGVKNTVADSLPEAILRHKPEAIQNRPRNLYGCCSNQKPAHDAHTAL